MSAAKAYKTDECGPKGPQNEMCNYWEVRFAKKLFEELSTSFTPTTKILICEWQDGADPGGPSKSGRGSFHGITASLLSDDLHNSLYNTYVLALGRESSSHSDVRQIVYDSMEEIQKPTSYFNGISNVEYQVVHLATMEDRKERGESHAFGSHNGAYTHRFGYSGKLVATVVSCNKCQKRRQNVVFGTHDSDNSCKKCNDWSFESLKFPAPEAYPRDLGDIDSEGNLNAFKVTEETMVLACKLATKKIAEKSWTLKTSEAYLKVAGVNTKSRESVHKNAKKEVPENLKTILPPRLFLKYAFSRNVEAMMHLLFLGNSELVGDSLHTLMVRSGKMTDFHAKAKKYLLELRGLYLDWAKFWTFGSTQTPFGPYVSENCLAWVRGIKSIYSNIDIIVTNNNNDERKKYLQCAKKVISAWVAVISRIMATRYTFNT